MTDIAVFVFNPDSGHLATDAVAGQPSSGKPVVGKHSSRGAACSRSAVWPGMNYLFMPIHLTKRFKSELRMSAVVFDSYLR